MNSLDRLAAFLFSVAYFNNRGDRERARLLYMISGILFLALVALNVGLIDLSNARVASGSPFVILFLLVVAGYALTRMGRLSLAAISLILAWALGLTMAMTVYSLHLVIAGVALVMINLLAIALLPQYGTLVGVLVSAAAVFVGLEQRSQLPPDASVAAVGSGDTLFLALLIAFVVVVTRFFLRNWQPERPGIHSEEEKERARLVESTSQMIKVISSGRGLEQAVKETVDTIVAGYQSIYQAQIFLLDETGKKVVLRASTGDLGQRLINDRFSINLNNASLIGYIIGSGEPVIEHIQASEAAQRNPYFPSTRVEAVLPLIVGTDIIGALDLHSEWPLAFPDEALPVLQTLAAYTTMTIENARLFDQAQLHSESSRQLARKSEATLRQVEDLNRQLTNQGWTGFLTGRQLQLGVDIDLNAESQVYNVDWTPDIEAAVENNQILERNADGIRVVAVPVRVRGEVIGAMEFELDENHRLSGDDRQMIEEVSERFGLAAENARLFDESRRIAQREALINEVGTRLQATSSVETTLIEAARSLQQILKANRVSIQLGEPPQAVENGKEGSA